MSVEQNVHSLMHHFSEFQFYTNRKMAGNSMLTVDEISFFHDKRQSMNIYEDLIKIAENFEETSLPIVQVLWWNYLLSLIIFWLQMCFHS